MMIRLNALPILGISLAAVLTSCKPAAPEATSPSPPEAKPASPAEIAQQIQSLEKLTMVHVWATWCDPCREEFPELVHVMEIFPDLDVILISGDDPAELDVVNAFLQEYKSPVGSLVSTELNKEFIEALSPTWAGSLPATFFYLDGKLVQEWEGKRTCEEYKEAIDVLLKNERSST